MLRGSLRILAGARHQILHLPQGLSHPWIVERCNRTFREGSLVLRGRGGPWNTRFHREKRTEEVENRKRPHWSLGRGALGGAERYWTFRVSHMMWTYTKGLQNVNNLLKCLLGSFPVRSFILVKKGEHKWRV